LRRSQFLSLIQMLLCWHGAKLPVRGWWLLIGDGVLSPPMGGKNLVEYWPGKNPADLQKSSVHRLIRTVLFRRWAREALMETTSDSRHLSLRDGGLIGPSSIYVDETLGGLWPEPWTLTNPSDRFTRLLGSFDVFLGKLAKWRSRFGNLQSVGYGKTWQSFWRDFKRDMGKIGISCSRAKLWISSGRSTKAGDGGL